MDKVLFYVPWLHIPIYGYGAMMVVGFFGAMMLAQYLARRSKIDPEIFVNAALLALVAGVVGARLSDVLENFHDFTDPSKSVWTNLFNAVNITAGGLTFYGGFLLAFPVLVGYGIYKKVPVRRGMDIVAPCLMIGLGFGRIGCLLNGCCYGAPADKASVPWAIHYPYASDPYMAELQGQGDDRLAKDQLPPPELSGTDQLHDPLAYRPQDIRGLTPEATAELEREASQLHSNWLQPAQIYSTITAWLLAALLVAFFTLPHAPGRVFALMLILEAPSRFILEMLRVEPAVNKEFHLTWLPPMSFSMVLAVPLCLVGIVMWLAFSGPKDDLAEVQSPPWPLLRGAAAAT